MDTYETKYEIKGSYFGAFQVDSNRVIHYGGNYTYFLHLDTGKSEKLENLPAQKGINTLLQLDNGNIIFVTEGMTFIVYDLEKKNWTMKINQDIFYIDKFWIRDGHSFAVIGEDQISLWYY